MTPRAVVRDTGALVRGNPARSVVAALESDSLGLRLMREAGYDPRAMISVMQKLEKASGGSRQPEFASTHPSPGNRIQRIREQLEQGPAPGSSAQR